MQNKNGEGYKDPTAAKAIRSAVRQEREAERRQRRERNEVKRVFASISQYHVADQGLKRSRTIITRGDDVCSDPAAIRHAERLNKQIRPVGHNDQV